ncbi:leukotriene-B4 omega-hydroxylase 3-like isoform X1 [Ruditapes philippinarum]|uniref:leukotriene-B4 omega-hydroxylase 3-like isoform X1 n=1 Tax=Ruditapes philippinarum TaxID=129788 RepID=UPI00295C009D|nr:leukotriene-B4 omega-hydroxylase 3-like isoform X1 [Ruditapes philippinarum]
MEFVKKNFIENNLTIPKLLVFSAVAYVVYLLVKFVLYLHELKRVFRDVPGPEKHWLYGNLHLIQGLDSDEQLKLDLESCNTFVRYYAWWTSFGKVHITGCHPDIARMFAKTSEPKPIGFMGIYRLGLPWLGEGLLIAGGKKWARARRLLTPAFHFDILKPYMSIYNDAADLLVGNLERYMEKKERFEVFDYISRATLDVIMRCAFSYQTDCQKDKGTRHPYVQAVEEIADAWNYRARKPWLYPDWLYYMTRHGKQFRKNCDYVHTVAEDVIKQRKEALDRSGNSDRKYLDFLDILLTAKDENGQGLTPLEIRNEVDTFMFEGHDTTASAISWILYSLAKYPEYQKKCQEEIDELLQGRDTDDIEWSDIPKLEYLTMCIKEGMRDHSPVPFIQREFTHDFEIDGKTFPAGTTVSLHIFGLHHNKNVWENPMEFIPERFSKENIAKMDTFQFVPFSAGPRNCIGQHFAMNEEKVIISKLLRRYWFELDETHSVRRKIGAVMRAENGIYLYVRPRDL